MPRRMRARLTRMITPEHVAPATESVKWSSLIRSENNIQDFLTANYATSSRWNRVPAGTELLRTRWSDQRILRKSAPKHQSRPAGTREQSGINVKDIGFACVFHGRNIGQAVQWIEILAANIEEVPHGYGNMEMAVVNPEIPRSTTPPISSLKTTCPRSHMKTLR